MLEKICTLLGLRRTQYPGALPALQPVIDEVASAWPFADAAIDISPAAPGVYLLYHSGRLLYIGLAVNGSSIREELARHRRGAYGEATRQATAFTYELGSDPRALHRRYLAAHRARYDGLLPPGNEREVSAA